MRLDLAIINKFLDDNEWFKYGVVAWGIMITLLFKMSYLSLNLYIEQSCSSKRASRKNRKC